MLDKWPLNVEVKGGAVPYCFKKIYICSNYHPKDWYHNITNTEPLQRRIYGKVFEFTVKHHTTSVGWTNEVADQGQSNFNQFNPG